MPERNVNKRFGESGIMRIDKAYFTVTEVLERWRMPPVDLGVVAWKRLESRGIHIWRRK
jgi:hypothetical protein